MNALFDKNDEVYTVVDILFGELGWFLARNTSQRYNYVYDQIICFGELLSTRIVSAYLAKIGIENNWFDVRNYIKTDSNYRDAKVNWELTKDIITNKIDNEEHHYKLKPPGIINPNSSSFCTIPAFNKGTERHSRGKNNKQNGH